MTFTFPVFKLPTMKWVSLGTIAKPATDIAPEHEIAYSERAFLRELLTRNPEAIQSDLGLMAMMTQYPQHF